MTATGTPPAIIEKINAEIQRIAATPEVQKRLNELGSDAVPMSPKEVQYLMEEKIIEIAPLGYMRGRTFKNCWIVADEMQNSTVSQMKMLLTRLGENSRLVITGDLEQFDRPNERNGLEDFLDKFRGKRSSSIGSFEFERSDIQREEVVKEILDIYGGEIPSYYTEDMDATHDTDTPDSES
jgi:phosphate starvation-inducible PhoH-like protein